MPRFTVTLKLDIEATDLADVEDIVNEIGLTIGGVEDITTEEIEEE
jgi:hypothetical protein